MECLVTINKTIILGSFQVYLYASSGLKIFKKPVLQQHLKLKRTENTHILIPVLQK